LGGFLLKKIIFNSFLFGLVVLLTPTFASAHPGNTDSNGGHYCWTNCEEWGYDYGEYHYHNGGYDDYLYNYVDYEKQLRQEYYNETVSEGDYLLKLLSNFNSVISSGDIKKIDGLYDQFTEQISYVEYMIGSVYGSENRDKLIRKYIRPSKIAKERVIYEVSQLRLLSDISYYVNADYDVDDEFAKLNRLVKRAEQIKKAGGYQAVPPKINHYLRYQEALIQGNYLNKIYFNEIIETGSISYISEEYDYFTKQIQITQAKIGKVYGEDNRNKLENQFVRPAKILKERVIYEVSQYRLLEEIESLYYSGDESTARNYLSKLDRLQRRAIEIKAAGGYKSLPPSINNELESFEDWIRNNLE